MQKVYNGHILCAINSDDNGPMLWIDDQLIDQAFLLSRPIGTTMEQHLLVIGEALIDILVSIG